MRYPHAEPSLTRLGHSSSIPNNELPWPRFALYFDVAFRRGDPAHLECTELERRLAAILAADVVGYSRLMEADERGTLARLRTHRIELIDPAIDKNNGRIIKTTGDGMLVEFSSVADAVRCALEVQERMRRRNADRSSSISDK